MHLLRTGDEPGARTALERAFKNDQFDAVTYNLLQMMDTLDKFVTVKDGDLIVRMHKDEAPVLQDYARAAGAPGARHAVEALRVHADAGRFSSRSSRSTTTSPCATSACPA